VRELVIFDPEAPKMAAVNAAKNERVRVRWQLWRRGAKGQWKREVESNEDRVQSEALCCWIRVVGKADARLLRLGLGPNGDELFLSSEEREAIERSEKERALAVANEAQQTALRERLARERAEARIAALEQELTKAKRKQSE
jgi:hypothetical protein